METTLSTLAQVFVGPLVGTISDYYGPAILEKIGIKWDVTEEMEKLSDILLTIQDVLEDAEDKQTTSKLIRHWLRKLKDVAYDVEDILDECATEALHDPESTGIIDKAAMIERIKRLINKFEEIAEQRSKFNLINLTSTTRVVHCRVDPRRETSSFPTELKVYGRDEEKECIVNLMVNNINAGHGNLSIYAIVGIGGLGKTTLAQMVYNDNLVTNRFEIKRWVCVSENFDLKSLIGDIIQFRSNYVPTLDELQCRLQEELSGKRFLLVLDDVWNEDEAKWERLKSSLSRSAKGSSIIVTTRSDKVATLMGTLHVCHPKMLSEEDCFSLFKHRAFAKGEGEHHPNLESIGKEIVKKCRGVPLAAKALGGLLRFKREEKEWLFVKESKLLDLPQDKDDSILPALRLSYKHLPQHLRQCFAYCSIFPKDYKINKEILIQLWMANGFLQPEGNMELEDIGNGIFNDLLWRGFFQEVRIDHLDNTVCKMHDLVHDLACSITRDECFSVVSIGDEKQVVRSCNTTRHLVVNADILFSPKFSLSMFQSFLRTLLQLDLKVLDLSGHPPPLNFSNLIYLRVLDLSGSIHLETLPIARMKLLRYLDLSGTHIALLSDEVFGNLINLQTLKLCECQNLEMLPGNMRKLTNLRYLDLSGTRIALLSDEVFGNLINLQTLKLRGCHNLEMLPGNMRKLTSLRHLDISGSTEKLLGMPVGMGQLKSLHKLSDFKVSEDSGCGVGELQELDHLGGTLAITCLWKVKDVRDAENAKLSRKQDIRALQLDWYRSPTASVPVESQTNSMNDKLIADALQPHPNIVSLDFHCYGGSDFPSWMNSTCLSSLVTLSLGYCSKVKHLPTLGLLPRLKKLSLGCIPVECIGNEFYCDEEEEEGNNMMMKTRGTVLFPALEELQLFKMFDLEEWKGWSSSSRIKEGEVQVSVLPVLKILKIHYCPKLCTIPPLPMSIEHLHLVGSNEKILERSLENLPHLSHLSIREFLRWSPDPSSLENLTALQILNISNCTSLVSLPERMQNLTSLRELRIERCDGLKSLNNCLQHLTNLHSLTIRDCGELELLPDDFLNLVSLQYLHIEALPNLPEGRQNLISLKELKIESCDGLNSLNNCLQHLTNLHELEIRNCRELVLLPDDFQNLISLEELRIFQCNGLKSLNKCLQHLTNLHKLEISYCRELELLPDDFQNLVSLQDLTLSGLPKLAAVPVIESTNQRLLQCLYLYNCENLKSLPEGLQHLTPFQRLWITGCHPELHRRCENTGEDWHKIAHIQELFIRLPE